MISQDDISAAPRQKTPFEVKPQETGTATESERNDVASDFGRFMDEHVEPSVQNSEGIENQSPEPIIIEASDGSVTPSQDDVFQTAHSQTEIEALFADVDENVNLALNETPAANRQTLAPLEADPILEAKSEAKILSVETEITKTHPIGDRESKLASIPSSIPSDGNTVKLKIETAETVKPISSESPAEPIDLKPKPESQSSPKAVPPVTAPSTPPVMTAAAQTLEPTNPVHANTRKPGLAVERTPAVEPGEVDVTIEADLSIDKLTLSRADREAQINTSLANQQMTERSLISSGPMALGNFALPADPAILTSLNAGLSPSIGATSSAPMLTAGAAPNFTLTTTLNAPSLSAVAQSIAKTIETQKGVSVRLDPPEMGRVYIDYIFDGERSVTALVRTDLPEALTQLRDQSAQLQSLLKEQGFENVNLSFDQNSSEQQSFDEHAFRDVDNYGLGGAPDERAERGRSHEAPARNRLNQQNTSLDIKL